MKKPLLNDTTDEIAGVCLDPFDKKEKSNYNKAQTIENIKNATIRIIRSEGLEGLRVNKIERESNRSKRMIYDYFGNLQGLVQQVLTENDPWLRHREQLNVIYENHSHENGKRLATKLLKEHFNNYIEDTLAQTISIQELTGKYHLLKEFSEAREDLAVELFRFTDDHFADSDIDIRMICALLIGGINYMVLHRNNNGTTFCGLDIHLDKHQELLNTTLDQIISWAYEQTGIDSIVGTGHEAS